MEQTSQTPTIRALANSLRPRDARQRYIGRMDAAWRLFQGHRLLRCVGIGEDATTKASRLEN